MSLTIYAKRKERKKKQLEELGNLLSKYSNFVVLSIAGVETPTLQKLRNSIRGKAELKVVKNTLFSKALDRTNLSEDIKTRIKKNLERETAVLFTNSSTFEIVALLDRFKKPVYLKPNRISPVDVVIPAGVTTLQPGPFTDSLTALGVPFDMKKNLVYIRQDTVVLKKGEFVNTRLADLLREMGLAPVISSIKAKCAVDEGLFIEGEKLTLNLEQYKKEIESAYENAFSLAFNSALPEPEVMPLLVTKAYYDSLSIAVECGIVNEQTAPLVFAKALSIANALDQEIKKASK